MARRTRKTTTSRSGTHTTDQMPSHTMHLDRPCRKPTSPRVAWLAIFTILKVPGGTTGSAFGFSWSVTLNVEKSTLCVRYRNRPSSRSMSSRTRLSSRSTCWRDTTGYVGYPHTYRAAVRKENAHRKKPVRAISGSERFLSRLSFPRYRCRRSGSSPWRAPSCALRSPTAPVWQQLGL